MYRNKGDIKNVTTVGNRVNESYSDIKGKSN